MKKNIIILLLFVSAFANAGVTTFKSKYKGTQINNTASTLFVQDDFFNYMVNTPTWPNEFTNSSVKNRIRFKYTASEKNYIVNNNDWSVTLTFDVKVRDENNNTISTLTGQTLKLENYGITSMDGVNESVLDLVVNGYQLSVDITNVSISGSGLSTPLADDFELIAEIETERYFKLNYSNPTAIFSHGLKSTVSSLCTNPTNDTWGKKLQIYWDYIKGAEEYEVEWYFNSDENDVQWSTANIATNVPSIEWTRITTTNNFYELNLPYDDGNLFYRMRPVGRHFDTDPTKKYYGEWTTPHDTDVYNNENAKNWQYNATYAEEGKVKEVVTYSDGSGRSRQAVTRSSTDNAALVTETYYDYEGRPTIQTLPTPDANNSQNLNFYCEYSLNNTNDIFKKVNYDNYSDCGLAAPEMGLDNGASRYYSSSNINKENGANQVIPDAEKFPYTHTVYGRDGRIKYQSSPGSEHSITNGDKYTEYAYATPLQYKLDRLFGNEVGYASHYSVDAVTDANGQMSLSYKDLSGNVVATSLIGESPTNLDPLSKNIVGNVEADFNSLNDYSPSTESFVINSKFLVEVTGAHTFNYTLTPEVVGSLCEESPEKGCVYDLVITIYDDCQEKIYDSGTNDPAPLGAPYDDTYNTVLHKEYITLNTATDLTHNTETTGDFIVYFDKTGTYSIRKELKLNEDALETAVEEFKDYYAANCLESTDLPIDDEPCLSCEDYCNLPGVTCDVDECDEQTYSCDILLEQIKADMSPGGQYFEKVAASSVTHAWMKNFIIPDNDAQWITKMQWPVSGITTWAALKANWQPGWEDIGFSSSITTLYGTQIDYLYEAHPEYCHYTICLSMEPSLAFDQSFTKTSTIPSAFGTGTTVVGNPPYVAAGTVDNALLTMIAADPFFATGGLCAACNMYNMPYPSLGSGTNLLNNLNDIIATSGQTTAATTLNDIWTYMKSTYLERKHLHVKNYKESQSCYYMLDYKSPTGIGNFDNKAETYLAPVTFFPTLLLNLNAFKYYHNDKFGATNYPPNDVSMADGIFLNMAGGVPLTAEILHTFYFTGFEIRVPDYTDFFTLINSGNTNLGAAGFPTSVQNFTSQFGTTVPTTPCDNLISNPNLDDYKTTSPCVGIAANDGLTYDTECLTDWSNIGANVTQFINTAPVFHALDLLHTPSPPSTADVIANLLTSSTTNGKTYTLMFDAKLTSTPYNESLLNISLSSGTSFDNNPTSGTYGPTGSNQSLVTYTDNNGSTLTTNWQTYTYTFTANGVYDNLLIYLTMPTGIDYTSSININNINLYEDCNTTITFDCFCTQLDLYEQTYAQDNSLTYPLTGTGLTNFTAYMATFYGTTYPTISPVITAAEVANWRANCLDPSVPLNRAIPDEINCNNDEPCLQTSLNIAGYYNNLFDSLKIDSAGRYYENEYKATCFSGVFDEDFTIEYKDREYHYTLYYYDRAGNLEGTVPPEGVYPLTSTSSPTIQDVDDYRNGIGTASYPSHVFETEYRYNTLNQLVEQNTPDGGTTHFYYDKLGRLKASQNAEQANQTPTEYSYTVYDEQGRITEVGMVKTATIPTSAMLDDVNFPSLWIGAANRYEVTYTKYDEYLNATINSLFGSNGQENLRSRVASTYLKNISSDATYASASHYSYDIHGNVKKLILDNPTQSNYGQQYKTLDYEYDLISGNVNKVSYQKNKSDQYYHKYTYDADNRIIRAYTSQDNLIWDNDAEYFYYLHGPLARTEIGDDKVQGIDNTYTIHGWLKGVNTNNIDPTGAKSDIGKDGLTVTLPGETPYYASAIDVHDNIGRDAFGFGLGYYSGDYQSISTHGDNFMADINSLTNSPTSLYNGNIGQMATSLMDNNEDYIDLQAANYSYDQLNRITGMNGYTNLTTSNYLGATTGQYNTNYSYDRNGNLITLNRKEESNAAMDDLDYYYYDNQGTFYNPASPPTWTSSLKPTNRLSHVTDGDGVTAVTDLGTQSNLNYDYDAIGNLISDDVEEIDEIVWNVYGKIVEIKRTGASIKDDLEFKYDPSGNRIRKTVKNYNDVDESDWEHYHYIRDASGNIMAIYHQEFSNLGTNLWQSDYSLVEYSIYGSSRIGTDKKTLLYSTTFAAQIGSDGEFEPVSPVVVTQPGGSTTLTTILTGGGFTITSGTGSNINYSTYSTNDAVITGGPFTNVVGAESYTSNTINMNANTVVTFSTSTISTVSTDPNTEFSIFGDAAFIVKGTNKVTLTASAIPLTSKYNNRRGDKVYELTNHLGNVLATVSDRKISEDSNSDNIHDYFLADVKSFSDYYPFGSLMPGRNGSSGDYRYGFNGKEQDDEIKNNPGTSYDFGARMYDPRIGKWFNPDAYEGLFSNLSPYIFGKSNPILFVDPDGNIVIPFFKNHSTKVAYNSQLSILKEDKEFAYIYENLDAIHNLPKINGASGLFNVHVTELPADVVANNEAQGKTLGGDERLVQETYNKAMKEGWTNYSMTAQIRLNPSRMNYSDMYEEFFHAGQDQFYAKIGIENRNYKKPNALTIEVEAKLAKMRSFYMKNKDLSDSDLKQAFVDNGFFEYEINTLFDGSVLNKDIASMLSSDKISFSMTYKAYSNIQTLVDGVKANYQHIPKNDQLQGDGFKFLNSTISNSKKPQK